MNAEKPDRAGRQADWEPLSQHTGALVRLRNIVEDEDGFRLVVAIFSNSAYRRRLIAWLGELIPETYTLDIATEQDFLEIVNKLQHLPSTTSIVHLLGAPAWFRDPLRAPALLHGLNYRREQFAADFPFVLVLWLYDAQVRELAQQAPDMWAWRAAVLDFVLPSALEPTLPQREIEPAQADAHERRQRLADIETYLMENPERYASDAILFREMSEIYALLGEVSQAEEAARRACAISHEYDDRRGVALALGLLADVFVIRGDWDEALRIHTEEELPVYERLDEVRLIALTKGKIADILQSRGELDKALRIRTEEELPVYERLDEVRSIAVTKGKIADILELQGELDEALQIRIEEQLPEYERLGEMRSIAVTKGKIADILQWRGELDEALRIRIEEELPVYERLGEVRLIAVALTWLFDLYSKLEEFPKAYESISRAYKIFWQLGMPDGISVVGFAYGKVLITNKQFAEAKKVLRRSRDAAAKLGQTNRLSAINALLADIDVTC